MPIVSRYTDESDVTYTRGQSCHQLCLNLDGVPAHMPTNRVPVPCV